MHVRRNSKGYGWEYRLGVPPDLRDAYGAVHVNRHISDHQAHGKLQADALGDAYAVQDRATFAILRTLPPEDRKAYLASGDVRKVIQAEDTVARIATIAAELVKNQPLILQAAAAAGSPGIAHAAVSYIQQVGTVQALVDKARDSVAVVQRHLGVKPKVIGNGLRDLFEVWKTSGKTVKKETRNHRATVELFIDKIGDLTGDDISPDHVRAFYDMNARDKLGPAAQIKHKEHLHAILKAAFSARRIKINPAAGIEVNNAAHAAKDTGEEETGTPFPKGMLRQVLNRVIAAQGFGKKERHADNLLALRLLCYSGLRPNECAQLRCSDVIDVDGVAVIQVRQGDGQSTKNRSSRRKVALHVAVRADVLARVKAGGEWLFATFPHNRPSQHSRWLCSDFAPFLKAICTVDGVRLYSTRHTFKDALWKAMPDDEMRRYVMGKLRDQHERYGSDKNLKTQAAFIDLVDPL
jgi:integrase